MFLFDEPPTQLIEAVSTSYLWSFFVIGFPTTVFIETIVLLFLLPPKLSLTQKLLCGVWLTACTYPIVVLVLPPLLSPISWTLYLWVAELYAHFGECFFFWLAFRGREDFETRDWIRSFIAILLANFASFSIGEVLNAYRWFGLF
jgi:hypothetical protein